MGTDIHWVIERQHADGKWEAICSKQFVWCAHLDQARMLPSTYDSPAFSFGRRNYHLFGILSNIRYVPEGQGQMLASEFLPDDASEHALMAIGPNVLGFHTHEHYMLGRLRAVVEADEDDCAPGEEEKAVITQHLYELEAMLAGSSEIDPQLILVGPERDDTGAFPEVLNLSNHQRLERKQRGDGLLPVGDDTVRVLFAFDS